MYVFLQVYGKKHLSKGETEPAQGPDSGVGMQVSGRGAFYSGSFVPGLAIFCFLVLSSTIPKLSSLCNLPNPGRPYHTDPQLRRARKIRSAPGLQQEWVGLARKFSGRILYEKFPTGLCLDNFESVIDKTGQLDTKYLFSGKSFVRNVQEKRSRKS